MSWACAAAEMHAVKTTADKPAKHLRNICSSRVLPPLGTFWFGGPDGSPPLGGRRIGNWLTMPCQECRARDHRTTGPPGVGAAPGDDRRRCSQTGPSPALPLRAPHAHGTRNAETSEARRVGKAWVQTCTLPGAA